MSGFEIAGIALAVLPILIAITGRTLPERDKLMETLKFEIGMLNLRLTNLNGELHNIPATIRAKLTSANIEEVQEGWNSTETATALELRLGDGLSMFKDALQLILNHLEELVQLKSLGLTWSHLLNSRQSYPKLVAICKKTPINSSDDMLFRVRFKFSQGRKLQRIVESIETQNKRLDKITKLSRAPPSAMDTNLLETNGSIRAPPMELRDILHELYRVVRPLWAACTCAGNHRVRLALVYSRVHSSPSYPDGEHIHFKLLVSPGCQVEPIASTNWHHNHLILTLQGSSAAASPPNGIQVQRFCEFVSERKDGLMPRIRLEANSLWDITREISAAHLVEQYRITGMATPLTAFISGSHEFTRKEKLILSVVLAHNVLYFCDTPWLREWDKEQVLFDQPLSATAPYVDAYFPAGFNLAATAQTDANRPVHPCPSILALGILLLEIAVNSTIESKRTRKDLDSNGNVTANTDQFTAQRLLPSIRNDLNHIDDIHIEVIEACLNCNFYDRNIRPNLDNPDFRQKVYENIIRPLELLLFFGFKITPTQLYTMPRSPRS